MRGFPLQEREAAEAARDAIDQQQGTAMSDLIERLEKATGLDWELDEAIWAFVMPDEYHPATTAPAFTSSLDAALTLVPESGYLRLARITIETWEAHIGFANRAKGQAGKGPTPALACCITALMARAALAQGQEII